MSRGRLLCALLCLGGGLATVGCDQEKFSSPLELGGQQVSAEELNRGLKSYRRYCIGCHGRAGDGDVPGRASMDPPPRDLTKGLFKYDSVPGDALPTDADLLRTLRVGLKGTHMSGWPNLPEDEARAVVQYIKTFSPRWRQEQPGRPVSPGKDPWGVGQRGQAVKRGELAYHALAQCWSCHPAYLSKQEILAATRAEWARQGKVPPASLPLRDQLTRSRPVVCAYGKVLPPDFLSDTLRTGGGGADLYRLIAAGVGGTPMPQWQEKLSERDLWALVHYIQDLVRIRGTPAAEKLKARRREQAKDAAARGEDG